MFIKGLFSPAGLIRPAKGVEMVVGFEEGEKYKKEVLEDPTVRRQGSDAGSGGIWHGDGAQDPTQRSFGIARR